MSDKKKIEPDLRNAPDVFRERIEALKKRGLFDKPEFKEAILQAAEEIAAEQQAGVVKNN